MQKNRKSDGQNRDVPVRVGDQITVVIESVGEKGDGVAKKNGFVLFVAGTKKGEKVAIKVTKVFSKVGFAQVIEKLGEGTVKRPRHAEFKREEVEKVSINVESPKDSDDFGSDLDEDY